MKLNFIYILADLGFGGVTPIYGTRKTNMPYNIYIKGYTYKVFQEPNEIQFGQKHQVKQEESTPSVTKKGCPNYIKIQINTWLRKNQTSI